jgi:glucose/mannose-6-phosphate isomerase
MEDSVKQLSGQVAETELALKKLKLPNREWKNAILIGMGGSALGAHVVQTLFAKNLSMPFEWRNSYGIPGYAGADTLVIFSSYSGTTEEVLAAYKEAKLRGTGMCVLTGGGELEKLARADRTPLVCFTTESNPGGQPRNGVAYNICGVWGILEAIGALSAGPRTKFAAALTKAGKKYGDEKTAHAIAKHVEKSVVALAASEHLEGNLHIFQNQIHETAKHFAFFDTISELNHHLMEGLKYPHPIAKMMAAVLFESKLYGARIKKRYPITAEVLHKQGVKVMKVELGGVSKLDDVAEMLVLGIQTSSLIAKHHHENPNFIPWVDFFKKKLSAPR